MASIYRQLRPECGARKEAVEQINRTITHKMEVLNQREKKLKE
jgi:hypothetical protein